MSLPSPFSVAGNLSPFRSHSRRLLQAPPSRWGRPGAVSPGFLNACSGPPLPVLTVWWRIFACLVCVLVSLILSLCPLLGCKFRDYSSGVILFTVVVPASAVILAPGWCLYCSGVFWLQMTETLAQTGCSRDYRMWFFTSACPGVDFPRLMISGVISSL